MSEYDPTYDEQATMEPVEAAPQEYEEIPVEPPPPPPVEEAVELDAPPPPPVEQSAPPVEQPVQQSVQQSAPPVEQSAPPVEQSAPPVEQPVEQSVQQSAPPVEQAAQPHAETAVEEPDGAPPAPGERSSEEPPPPPPRADADAEAAAVEEPAEDELLAPDEQDPVDQVEQTEAFVFEGDTSCWCSEGLPEEWTPWVAPDDSEPATITEQGYDTGWDVVDASWADDGVDLATVDPAEVTLAELVGPGHAADQYWGDQGQTNYCGLYSVRSILSELYGTPVDVDEMVQRASANGWLVFDDEALARGVGATDPAAVKGIHPQDIDDILASYGVPSHEREGEEGAWEDLNSALQNGQRVVIGLDSKEIDAGTNVGDDPVTGVGRDMDHFVAITGIDYEHGVVIVNDSARSAGLEIPLSVFYESWRDSDFAMAITDLQAPDGGGALAPSGSAGFVADPPSYALLGGELHFEYDYDPFAGEVDSAGDSCCDLLAGPVEAPDVAYADPLTEPVAQTAMSAASGPGMDDVTVTSAASGPAAADVTTWVVADDSVVTVVDHVAGLPPVEATTVVIGSPLPTVVVSPLVADSGSVFGNGTPVIIGDQHVYTTVWLDGQEGFEGISDGNVQGSSIGFVPHGDMRGMVSTGNGISEMLHPGEHGVFNPNTYTTDYLPYGQDTP